MKQLSAVSPGTAATRLRAVLRHKLKLLVHVAGDAAAEEEGLGLVGLAYSRPLPLHILGSRAGAAGGHPLRKIRKNTMP